MGKWDNALFTAIHSFASSPEGRRTTLRKFPLPRVAEEYRNGIS
jgi:hypothetical protein